MREIYFDHAATTKPYPEVLSVFDKVSRDDFANASSRHALGLKSHDLLEKARRQIARYLDVKDNEVIFTSGASEGNNLAIKGVAYHNKSWANRIITTKAEHPSVRNVFEELQKEGFDVVYLDYDKDGNLNLDELKNALNSHTSLVSIRAVNNELGDVFPISKAYEIIQQSKAVLHVDATQAIGKEPIRSSDYDLRTFSGHKIGGLKGSGLLVKKERVRLDEQILGGSQESGYRAGTSMLPLDCSLATALRLSLTSRNRRRENAKKRNDYLRAELSKMDEIVITSPSNGSPFILSFAFTKHKGSVIAQALSDKGIYVSTKSACSAREAGFSSIVKNAGFDEIISSNNIRLSFSGREEIQDGEYFIQTLKDILQDIKIKE